MTSNPEPFVLTLAELDAHPWASCGPAALAALLGRSLADVRHAFPNQQPGKTWTTFAMMDRALKELGVEREHTTEDIAAQLLGPGSVRPKSWPTRGLAIIQFRGSWDAMPVHHPAQLQRTHWIAVRDGTFGVFDVNVVDAPGARDGWIERRLWERYIAPWLAEGYGKKATGAWWVRAGIEVRT